jgi:hypothetical protein
MLIRYDSKDPERVRGRRRVAQAEVSRRDRLVGREGQAAQGHRHRRGARRRRAALIRPGHVWSREEVLDWLLERAAKEPTLFGFDFSFAPPFVERGEYLPGEPDVPKPRANSGPMSTRKRRRGPRRGELPRGGPPQAFLFRHRRRGEGRLRPLPPVRRAAQRAGRPQDRQRL